jgi:hypothetical protein
MENLYKHLENKDYTLLLKELNNVINDLSEKQKQQLLTDIVDLYYEHRHFSFFKKIYDRIIGSKLNLNFNIDHWAPTFLSLVVLRSPSIELFEYFVKKGADINFIGDTWAFYSEEDKETERDLKMFEQYQTCLDFAQLKLDDLLTVDYNYSIPEKKINLDWRESHLVEGEITISKMEYLYLHEQSEYLNNLINTDKLKDHIVRIGGKTYEDLDTGFV